MMLCYIILYCILHHRVGSQVGVLDFGDSIYSCRIFEPAICAGYFCLGQADPALVLEEILREYLQNVPFDVSEEEVTAYFHAARGRILLSVAFAAENSTLERLGETCFSYFNA